MTSGVAPSKLFDISATSLCRRLAFIQDINSLNLPRSLKTLLSAGFHKYGKLNSHDGIIFPEDRTCGCDYEPCVHDIFRNRQNSCKYSRELCLPESIEWVQTFLNGGSISRHQRTMIRQHGSCFFSVISNRDDLFEVHLTITRLVIRSSSGHYSTKEVCLNCFENFYKDKYERGSIVYPKKYHLKYDSDSISRIFKNDEEYFCKHCHTTSLLSYSRDESAFIYCGCPESISHGLNACCVYCQFNSEHPLFLIRHPFQLQL